MKISPRHFITARLLAILLLITALIMTAFVFVRYHRAQIRLESNLENDAQVISSRIASAIAPTIWNIYHKTSDVEISQNLTSAILDAEMISTKVISIRVYSTVDRLYFGRVRVGDNIEDYQPTIHDKIIKSALVIKKTPIKLESVNIGSVEITLSDRLFTHAMRTNLQIEFAQVLVVGGLILFIVFYVLQRALVKPLLDIKIAKQTLEAMVEGVVIIDHFDRIMDVNKGFLKLLGCTYQSLIDSNFKIDSFAADAKNLRERIRQGLKSHQSWSGEVTLIKTNNQTFPAWLEVRIIRNKDRTVAAFVFVVRDMTDQKNKEEELERMAYQDPLTSLANRACFERQLKHDIAVCRRLNSTLCLFYIDLDDFKMVNDAFGHEAGDKLLVEISQRFRNRLRETDTLARLGGDEFTVILPNLDGQCEFEKMARELISLAGSPIQIGDIQVYVGASIGAAIYPDDGKTVTDLLKHADIAMYRAKSRGRNRISFYSQDFDTHSQKRIALEAELRHAIQNNHFELYYQAKVLMSTGAPTGYEALLRWKRKDGRDVPPSEFIPIAEERGLIIQLGRWIIHNALTQMKKWHRLYSPTISLAINISPVQFHDHELLEFLIDEIATIGISPETIEIEITETTIIKDIEYSAQFLRSLKDIGVKISIDDFGTGYSSLRYLQQLPIDTLKIDRVFVSNIELANKNQAIAKTVISLADNLDLDVVVEGVELEAQAKILAALGCKVGQGFLYAKPAPAQEIEKSLALLYPPKTD